MNFSKFFIDRPIFAAVLSVIIFVAGLLSIFALPISEYPDVVPPSVVVRAQYRCCPAGRADQRHRGHAVHVLAIDRRRRAGADSHF
jgi:multidrug efflux pump subunit AcrB